MADQSPNFFPAGDTAVCAECGQTFNEGDLIRHGNAFICASCKPVFMQKLAEGANINQGGLNIAGGGIRTGAWIIDYIIMVIVNQVIKTAFGLTPPAAVAGQKPDPVAMLSALVPLLLAGFLIELAYETFFIGKFGATPGKMVCKIKVVTADGGRVSYLRAMARHFAKILSGLILAIGFLMAFFDDEKRALHDRICNTRVISTKPQS